MKIERQLEHHEVKNTERGDTVFVLCEGMESPQNRGMVFRLADAFGVEKVIFVGEMDLENDRKMRKTARGTEQIVKHGVEPDLHFLEKLKAGGFVVLGLEITSESKDIRSIDFSDFPKKILCVGSEKYGISPELLSMCDFCVHIPMFGENSSLNVVHALSIGLYASAPTFEAK